MLDLPAAAVGVQSLQPRGEREVSLPLTSAQSLSSPCCACMRGLCYSSSMSDRSIALPSHKPPVRRHKGKFSKPSFLASYQGLHMKEKFTMAWRFCHDWKCNNKNIAVFFFFLHLKKMSFPNLLAVHTQRKAYTSALKGPCNTF